MLLFLLFALHCFHYLAAAATSRLLTSDFSDFFLTLLNAYYLALDCLCIFDCLPTNWVAISFAHFHTYFFDFLFVCVSTALVSELSFWLLTPIGWQYFSHHYGPLSHLGMPAGVQSEMECKKLKDERKKGWWRREK